MQLYFLLPLPRQTVPIDSFHIFISKVSCLHLPHIPSIPIPIDSIPHSSHVIQNDRSIAFTFHPPLSSFKPMTKEPHTTFLSSFYLISIINIYHSHQLNITVISTTTLLVLLCPSSIISFTISSFHIPSFVFHDGVKRNRRV